MRFLFPHHFNTIQTTNKQTQTHTHKQQSSFNNIDYTFLSPIGLINYDFKKARVYNIYCNLSILAT